MNYLSFKDFRKKNFSLILIFLNFFKIFLYLFYLKIQKRLFFSADMATNMACMLVCRDVAKCKGTT